MDDAGRVTPEVRPLRRAAVRVRDLDLSLRLYRDSLGLVVWKHGEAAAADPDFFRLLGLQGLAARFAILQADRSEIGMVGLFEVTTPAPEAVPRRGSRGMAPGEVALVFLARNLPELHRRVTALGLPVICPPVEFSPPGGRPALEMTFRDFDGALVNLIEAA
jgi:catechol 2,3-dioxygenase-like lactoylglutathione lyase family enzyme